MTAQAQAPVPAVRPALDHAKPGLPERLSIPPCRAGSDDDSPSGWRDQPPIAQTLFFLAAYATYKANRAILNSYCYFFPSRHYLKKIFTDLPSPRVADRELVAVAVRRDLYRL